MLLRHVTELIRVWMVQNRSRKIQVTSEVSLMKTRRPLSSRPAVCGRCRDVDFFHFPTDGAVLFPRTLTGGGPGGHCSLTGCATVVDFVAIAVDVPALPNARDVCRLEDVLEVVQLFGGQIWTAG